MISLASPSSVSDDIDSLFSALDAAPSTIWIALRAADEVMADAQAIRERVDGGEGLPLAGLTFAVKDNIDVAAMQTTAAHPAFTRVADRHATVVERLIAAGALLIGKTNMDQFATGLVGARSPHGVVTSALDPQRVAGGSSSGSGAAVGHGLVDFSLGTDTAGSGRVPAAFNGILGIKPTLGLLPLDGVVPASPSYDTVSVFATTTALAARIMSVITGSSPTDPKSRDWALDAPHAAPARPVIALPGRDDLVSLSPAARAMFDDAVTRFEALGAEMRTIDLAPFLATAALLYGGGLVSERAWSYGAFLAAHPEGADPSVAAIAAAAMQVDGTAVIDAQQSVAAATRHAREVLAGTDAMLIPTAPIHPTVDEVASDPIGVNSVVGTFTNFVNLMDMAAVAVPTGTIPDEGAFGVSIVTPRFHDQVALDLAARLLGEPEQNAALGVPGADVAVFGAHLSGEPLNPQLQSLGARLVGEVRTADRFRMLLIEGEVDRPAVVRSTDGAEIPGELWRFSPVALSTLLRSIGAPLALGQIELADGSSVLGFTASVDLSQRDITDFGGWRAFRAASALPVTV
ncbi:allophanate hydrolase [Microbacterium profundi]|uniref:Allophanate hydrolase n=1 Tax=Microbacterium profundi TaxID=450380 RepID=A0ABV3LJQ8_9MICO